MKIIIIKILDWAFQKYFGADRNSFKLLPTWPSYLCGLITNHLVCLEWADYIADVSGVRCRCGLANKSKDYGNIARLRIMPK